MSIQATFIVQWEVGNDCGKLQYKNYFASHYSDFENTKEFLLGLLLKVYSYAFHRACSTLYCVLNWELNIQSVGKV